MTKVYFETFGCSANVADTEQMMGLLKAADFETTTVEEEADIIILNTCTVKGPTESKLDKRLKELKDGYKITILAGCLSQGDPKKYKEYPIIGTNQIHKVVEVVEEALNDNNIQEIAANEKPPLNTPLIRKNPIREIIPINRGCLGFCTFCKTKSARGNLSSYTVEEIILRAQKAINEGVKEIWLTSQDTGCYGFDIGTDLPRLLNELVQIEGDFKIRVGMMNPDHMPKIEEELIKIYNNPKIYKFLHLPLQAGNDQVLERMKRLYTVEEYKRQIKLFKENVPQITIANDMIVGFPGETPEQFYDSITVTREISPDIINISKFWPRPNTPAARMKKVDGKEIKRRSQVLTDIFHNISKLENEKWQDWQGKALITEKGKGQDQWIARNLSYKPIVITNDNLKLGQTVEVRITKTTNFHLVGEITKNNLEQKTNPIKLEVVY